MNTSRRTLLKTLAVATLPAMASRPSAAALAARPALALPGRYTDGIDPAPYLVSEKYDYRE